MVTLGGGPDCKGASTDKYRQDIISKVNIGTKFAGKMLQEISLVLYRSQSINSEFMYT